MDERAEVVVVGAGLGGLAAAVALARAGKQVLVLEAAEVAGGYAANFERPPYRFDVSLHLLDAVEPGGANRPLWEHLGLDRRVVTAVPDTLRDERWPEHAFAFPQGLAGWVESLAAAFPGEEAGLRALAARADAVWDAAVADRDARLAARPSPELGALTPLLDRAATAVLREHLRDPRLVGIAGALSCYLGLGGDELAAIPFLAMLASYGQRASYPIGGSGAIAAALVEELRAHGGELRLSAPVTAVRCRQRVAVGVTTADGEIDAAAVVANVAPPLLYGSLVAADQVEPRFRARLERMSRGTSVVKVWLGCTRDPAPALPYETFLRTTYDTAFIDGAADELTVVLPHRLDPGCAPAGAGAVSITAGIEGSSDPADKARHQQIAAAMVRAVDERLIPGLAAAAEVQVVATPSTFHRYTGNPGGVIHGFRPIPSQSGPRRLGVGGPIGGLYQVGGWTYGGSGFTPAMTSGLAAAAQILGGLPGWRDQ